MMTATATSPAPLAALKPTVLRIWTLLALVGIALAVVAQNFLGDQRYPVDGVLVYGVALALFVRSMARIVPRDATRGPAVPRSQSRPRATRGASWLLFGSATCAVLAYQAFESHTFTRGNGPYWAAALLFFFAAVLPLPRVEVRDPLQGALRALSAGLQVRISPNTIGFVVVVAVAIAFRFYQLPSVPAEPTSDHAEKLLDVRDVLEGNYRTYFPRNTGREPLQFYIAAPLVSVFGLSHLMLKAETAAVGLLSVIGMYLLGNELFGRGYGLLAALLLAVAPWEVGTARLGLRFPFATAATVFTLYFFFRALRTGANGDFIGLGLVLGLGLNGYSSYRIVPPLILLLGALWIVWQPTSPGAAAASLARGLGLSFGLAALLLLPLIRYMIDNPAMFWLRAASRLAPPSAAVPHVGPQEVVAALAKALLMFNWRGDVGWTVVVPLAPLLDAGTGALFILGAGWLGYAAVCRRSFVARALLISLPILLAPSWASFAFPNENPSANRSVTALPVVFAIAALPLGLAWRALAVSLPSPPTLLVSAAITAGFLVPVARANFDRYFVSYAETHRRSVPNTSELAQAVRPFISSLGSMTDVHTLLWPHWFDNRNLAFALGQPGWDQVVRDGRREIAAHATEGRTRLYLVHPSDVEGRAILRASYPAGVERLHRSQVPGKDFLTFTVLARG